MASFRKQLRWGILLLLIVPSFLPIGAPVAANPGVCGWVTVTVSAVTSTSAPITHCSPTTCNGVFSDGPDNGGVTGTATFSKFLCVRGV